MANQRDIDRWKKGKDHWNKWAEGRLKAKEKLVKEGKWEVDEYGRAGNPQTERWFESASVDFSGHVFDEDAKFSRFLFPGDVNFSYSKFEKTAWFIGAIFEGGVWFNGAAFKGDACFYSTTFEGETWFSLCTFDSITLFDFATFIGNISFTSATSDGPFSLAYTTFGKVPEFIQMSFHAPARLDNIDIAEARPFQRTGMKEKAARYRALKKMAIEAHDHVRELEFFASEARERRGNDDPVWSAAWVFSYIYELFSDFGRSFVRPLAGLAALSIIFTFVYVLTRNLGAWLKCGPDGLVPIGKAAYLSFVNSLPFIGLGKSEQIKLVSNCLYGTEALPLGITIWTTLQTLLGTVLVFLFVLALRNRFRIK